MHRQTRLHLVALFVANIVACDLQDPSEPGMLVPPTVEDDPSIPALEVNGTTLHVETFGEPREGTIIMLHGGPGMDFRGLLRLRDAVDGRRLEDSYRLVFWDQRGTGLSQRVGASRLTMEVYIADLDALVERYAPGGDAVLVGHSWGGMFAAAYVEAHPEKVRALVLMEPGPLTGALYSEMEDQIIDIDLGSEWLNDVAWSARLFTPDDHARADFLAAAPVADAMPRYHLSRDDPMPMWRYGALAAEAIRLDGYEDGVPAWDFTDDLDAYDGATLFVASSLSSIGEGFQARQMAFFPSAQLATIPDCGHDHPWTRSGETLHLIFEFLDGLEDRGDRP